MLPPFNPEATCPKCGYDLIGVLYQRFGCSYPARCGVRHTGPEHLDRVCQRCHYEWAEDVLSPAGEPVNA